uniref:Uncharacterized protein n=1 Tax=viral metagenome TaxID=1070528 RepID=A0A6C0C0G3_9ZZZZ
MSGFERKMIDGKANPKYVDLCDEDAPIAGQKFTCLSFVSPENILKRREQFLFEEFVKSWDFTKSMSKFFDFIHFMSYKYNLNVETTIEDFNEFVKDEKDNLKKMTVEDDYKTFMDKNEERLNEEFNRKNVFQTSVRGLKVRGVYNTQEEAEHRCKSLRDIDPNHDIFVGPVGMWIPWDPDAYKTGRVEFMEEELNQLHSEKMKNETKAKDEFEKRVRETKKKAIEDNIKKAEESGNVLTQTIDDDGNLTGVTETVDFESREVATEDGIKEHNTEVMKKIVDNTTKED